MTKRKKDEKISPFNETTILSESKTENISLWYDEGIKLISLGKVGAILLAGGQGTRLGFDRPKGCYDLGLPSHKTLFHIQADRIIKLKLLAAKKHKIEISKISLPWYIMTSFQTDMATREFFKEQKHFGLDEKDIFFFSQGNLPCLTSEGKIILESPYQVSQAPNGNGGVYRGLKMSGALDDMKRRGVVYNHFYGVDNVLVKVADPVFIGFVHHQKSECGNKVVLKTDWQEKVGVMCNKNGKAGVVEYSELTPELSQSRGSDGQLIYSAGNIGSHVFSTDFLQTVADADCMPFHVAKKKIPHVDNNGKTVTPDKENGMKLEMFVFDSFALAKKMVCLAVLREGEFTAVKNATGIDSPHTARQDISQYHMKLATSAGAIINFDKEKDSDKLFEISPLVSYAGEGLNHIKGKTFSLPCLLDK